ncbi:MAG: TonB-dependent receptor [Ignavibacteria bacterium]|nr:TonB-dependent receptor [Ignavibacteria bacterium]
MSSGTYRVISLSLICLLFLSGVLFAGTTGKITGRIIDKETGEPLYGVNVVVMGTMLGAATDIEGDYVILNVPPGTHTVKASMIGYSSTTINEVRVKIDETTNLDIEMVLEAISTEDIVVVAKKDVIKKDVSTSVTGIAAAEMQTLPVSSITEVIGLQAGVEEGMVIRGGESDQLLFQVDGITLRDPRNNKPITSISMSAIQEVSIERGGFNAEYGQVRSGIANIVYKEGSTSNYEASIQVKYSPANQKHLGISVYDPNSMWNRPYLDPAVCWTGTENGTWDKYEQRQYPEFEGWNSLSHRLLTDSDPSNDLTPAGAKRLFEWERRRRPSIEPDYIIDGSFGGPFPLLSSSLGNLRFFTSFRFEKEMLLIPLTRDDYQDYYGSIKLTSDVSKDVKLVVNGSYGKNYNVALNADDNQFNSRTWGISGTQFWNPTDFMRTPFQIASITNEQRASRIFTDSWYSEAEVSHYSLSGKLTSFINPNTFYEVSIEHLNRKYQTGPIRTRDNSKIYEVVPGYFVDEAPFGFDPYSATGITGMFFGTHSSQIRDSSNISSYVVKGDITSQLFKEHLFKAGISFSFFDLNLNYGKVKEFFNETNYVKEKWQPYQISMYLQDKMEMLGFIANIGLRVDISNPNTEWVDVDPFDKEYFSAKYSSGKDYPKKKAEVDVSVSPRLGIAHPITEDSKLYFNFGHFKQMPAYEEIFRLGRATSGALQNYGNPNLIQAKTVSYELGYDHVLFTDYLIQVAAFYNDITNQQAYTQYVSDRKNIGYFAANNNSYEDIRGIEFTFKKTYGDWVRGFVNFTYQVNTLGAFGKQTIDENRLSQKKLDENTLVLYQQKPVPKPRANVSFTFFTPNQFGPEFLGIYPLDGWSLDVLGNWIAGEYVTYNPKNLSQVVNNVQVTDYYNIDLRINKSFNFDKFSVMLYMDISNLLNAKRLSGKSFYDGFDQQFYLASLHLPKNEGYDNIVGEDRVGDYRKTGVPYQPVFGVEKIETVLKPGEKLSDRYESGVIYYDKSNSKYVELQGEAMTEVDKGRMDKLLEDKAYIDMPNNTSFSFLDPRQIYFGINLTFKF